MGMRIDHIRCLVGELIISGDGQAWLSDPDMRLPECAPEVNDGIVDMYWSGEGSAYADDALKKFFSFTSGTAEFLFYWAGMGVEGIRVVDGVMTKHEVEMKLGRKIK